jgi:hypothetical protein
MVIMMVRSSTPASLISKTLGPEKLNIPKAPALGLLLERPIFSSYNTRVAANDEPRSPVEFDPYEVKHDSAKISGCCQYMSAKFKLNFHRMKLMLSRANTSILKYTKKK